ncbi:NAD(P)H oxidoreductase [Marimonas sp. MJW-29]|uniref:NAD(P)H oxidoreductase n=1 Tax=Sulfitobacter sediminis TaxID=3234186 RepID=A0ABV3RTL9_9RHOB
MNVLVVFDHPRRKSLSGAVLDQFVAGLRESGHTPEIADLHAERFDPRMPVEDEPNLSGGTQSYTDAVQYEQARVERNDAVAFIFPVWWWSVPAMTKGWIDRVWNADWAYGKQKLALDRALLVGLAATGSASFKKRGYTTAMETQLIIGVMNFCGITNARLELLHDTLEGDNERQALLVRARTLGRTFTN